tara:strand:+ start:3014 stop:3445 length:432 start_codon:yes stop_codon:yes gene_type:complete
MRQLFFGVLLFIIINLSYSQVVRFSDGYIGIQTPHEWKVYSHLDTKIFGHPMSNDYNVNVIVSQFGYNWFDAKRGNVRSGIEHTLWFLTPNSDKSYNGYWGIIPVAFNMYPFRKDYVGIDLYTKLDPYRLTLDSGFGILIKIN